MASDDLRKQTVLIVDDEKLIRRAMSLKLSKAGYTCLEASCASEALDQLRARLVNLVILDTMMPGTQGIDLLLTIRSSFPDTAVIVATAKFDNRTVVKYINNGAHDYIPKPFLPDELLVTIDNAMVKSQFEHEIKGRMDYLMQTGDDQSKQIRKLTLNSFEALVMALEAKDEYTAGHSRRVVQLAESVALEMMLYNEDMDDLHWGALLHDIGKIAVDPRIQNKQGKLTREEYRHIMIHAQIGPAIVKPVANKEIQNIILHHHDRYDGRNYGQEISGEDIPISARIVAVADAFDAMTSNRPYRQALSLEKACNELVKGSGAQFDPKVVKAFLRIYHRESILLERTLPRDKVISQN